MTRLFAFAQHLTAFSLLGFFTLRVWRNLRFLRRAHAATSAVRAQPAKLPRVSVLVPARNEARSIAACVESLASQCYPDFEVVVLDDQSTDATGAIVAQLARDHANVRVLRTHEAPPPGFNGKSLACQRLADDATGEWLLFTDADTIHTPQSIAHGVAQARALGVDLLSALPRQLTRGVSEQIIVSFIMDFLPIMMVDLPALCSVARDAQGKAKMPGNAVAVGQYLLVRADVYRHAGGHKAIARALVDDFALAAHLRDRGSRIALVNGVEMVACRMYQSPREVWQGFSRNVIEALETSVAAARTRSWQLFFAWGYACVFIMPWFRLLFGADRRIALLEAAWLTALRALANEHFARPRSELVTTPLAAAGVMAFAIGAILRRLWNRPVTWKDRVYRATSAD